MKIIYVRGGDTQAPRIARESGMLYGIRADTTAYAPVHMLDVDFHRFKPASWAGYMDKVRQYRPVMALAPDYGELPLHTVTRYELYTYIHDLICEGVPEILVCPKFVGAVDHMPDECIIAVSVPAPTYAGFLPDLKKLAGRRVHLLGGNVYKQADLIKKINGAGGCVVSVDGSHHTMAAGHGRWFDGAYWHQLRGKSVCTRELELASSKSVVRYLMNATQQQQPHLF